MTAEVGILQNNYAYSGDLNSDHLNTKLLKFGFQMVGICAMFLFSTI